MKNVKLMSVLLGIIAGAFLFTSIAQADMKQIKAYKEAYPEAKPKCINCHADALPKKEDGKHENNDYGKAARAEAQKEAAAKDDVAPTTDVYKAIGKIEDFKAPAAK